MKLWSWDCENSQFHNTTQFDFLSNHNTIKLQGPSFKICEIVIITISQHNTNSFLGRVTISQHNTIFVHDYFTTVSGNVGLILSGWRTSNHIDRTHSLLFQNAFWDVAYIDPVSRIGMDNTCTCQDHYHVYEDVVGENFDDQRLIYNRFSDIWTRTLFRTSLNA